LKWISVEVHTGSMVQNLSNQGVTVNGKFVAGRTVVWAAGDAAAPIGKSFGAKLGP